MIKVIYLKSNTIYICIVVRLKKSWKSIAIPLLLGATFFSSQILQLYYIADFYVHQTYYAEYECIQKDIPANCCQGSCVLEKELNTTTPDKTTHSLIPVLENELFQEVGQTFFFSRFVLSDKAEIPRFEYFVSNPYLDVVTPPPKIGLS